MLSQYDRFDYDISFALMKIRVKYRDANFVMHLNFNEIGLNSNRIGLEPDGGLFIIVSFLPNDGSSYICVIHPTEKCIHVLQSHALGFWNAVPNEDEQNHIDCTEHIHSVATKTVSISIF